MPSLPDWALWPCFGWACVTIVIGHLALYGWLRRLVRGREAWRGDPATAARTRR